MRHRAIDLHTERHHMSTDLFAWTVRAMPIPPGKAEKVARSCCIGAKGPDQSGGMLAFTRKKFVGSYFALSAVRRVHCLSV
jgi:hypothetical protein